MNLDDLNNFIKDVKDDNIKSLQSVINIHFTLLEALNKRYTWITILEYINNALSKDKQISQTTFHQSLSRARNKNSSNTPTTPTQIRPLKGDYITPNLTKDTQQKESIKVKKDNPVTANSKMDWAIKCNIKRERLIEDLEAFGLTPDDVKEWKLPNENSIRNHLEKLKERESIK